jgi:hypothetical protein
MPSSSSKSIARQRTTRRKESDAAGNKAEAIRKAVGSFVSVQLLALLRGAHFYTLSSGDPDGFGCFIVRRLNHILDEKSVKKQFTEIGHRFAFMHPVTAHFLNSLLRPNIPAGQQLSILTSLSTAASLPNLDFKRFDFHQNPLLHVISLHLWIIGQILHKTYQTPPPFLPALFNDYIRPIYVQIITPLLLSGSLDIPPLTYDCLTSLNGLLVPDSPLPDKAPLLFLQHTDFNVKIISPVTTFVLELPPKRKCAGTASSPTIMDPVCPTTPDPERRIRTPTMDIAFFTENPSEEQSIVSTGTAPLDLSQQSSSDPTVFKVPTVPAAAVSSGANTSGVQCEPFTLEQLVQILKV